MENDFSLKGLYLLISSAMISSLSDCSYLLNEGTEQKSLSVFFITEHLF